MPQFQWPTHSFDADLTETFVSKKKCLADSGISRSAFGSKAVKTSAVRDSAPYVYSYPLHAVDRTLVGLMAPPPFSWLLCLTISSLILYLRFKLCVILLAQRTVATNLIVSSSKKKTSAVWGVTSIKTLSLPSLQDIDQTLNGVHVPLQFSVL